MKTMKHFIQQWDELQAFLETSIDELRERAETLVEAHKESVDATIDIEDIPNWPSTYTGWDIINMSWSGTHLRVEFRHCIPYDDHEDYATLIIDPAWWEMSDDELLKEFLNQMEYMQEKRHREDVKLMKTLAEECGYDVVEK